MDSTKNIGGENLESNIYFNLGTYNFIIHRLELNMTNYVLLWNQKLHQFTVNICQLRN
jgi:hypothetical protein